MSLELQQGALIGGRFRLERLLGKGGMGQVWAATHEVTGREHALKFLNTPDASAEARARFLREARLASRVDHPNVITIHDAFELDDGIQVMVMDLLPGETLREELARRGTLSPVQAADIFLSVVSAVGTAHAKGIVHRDLKPENIFLVEGASAAERVQVLDFGIAKLAQQEGETMTQTGQVLGTPAYMALEQCTGEGELDQRVDVWAIGVMLYEALSGSRPIEADTLGNLVAKLMRGAVQPLSSVVEDVPEALTTVVDRMLAREPEGRPSDLREVAAILAQIATVEAPAFGAASSGPLEPDSKARSRSRSAASDVDPEAKTELAARNTEIATTERATVGAAAASSASADASGRSRLWMFAVAGLVGASLWLLSGVGNVDPAPGPSSAAVVDRPGAKEAPSATSAASSTTNEAPVGVTSASAAASSAPPPEVQNPLAKTAARTPPATPPAVTTTAAPPKPSTAPAPSGDPPMPGLITEPPAP